MGDLYKDRYGIPGKSVTSLLRRYYRYLSDSDWDKADDFLKWCSENGWQSGLRLCRIDKAKPHGPYNSFFKPRELTKRAQLQDNRRRKEERMALVSPFCEGCTEECKKGVGCEKWQQYYVNNWDQNINIAKPVKKEPVKRQVFRYEHPDLVREGIVFEHRQSIP